MNAPALPAGRGLKRLRLWDNQWQPIWDSATATTPAYQRIPTWCHATIDYPGGYRQLLRLTRTRSGIQRENYNEWDHLRYIVNLPNPHVPNLSLR